MARPLDDQESDAEVLRFAQDDIPQNNIDDIP